MKKYLIIINDEKLWSRFKKRYKEQGLGDNLEEAIMELIKRFVEGE